MKFKYIVVSILMALSLTANCQREIFISDVPFLREMVIFQNSLYFNYNTDTTGIIAISDLSNQIGDFTIFFEIDHRITDLAVDDHFLYYSVQSLGEVHKIDLLANQIEPEVVCESLIQPRHIAVADNFLYVTTPVNETNEPLKNENVIKISFDNLNEEPLIIADSIDVTDMAVYRGQLFFSTSNPPCVFKYNGEISLVDCTGPINGIDIRNDILYTPNATTSFEYSGEILALNLLDNNAQLSVINQDVIIPLRLAADDSHIYVYEEFRNISRIKLEKPSSLQSIRKSRKITVYPNPSISEITVEGIENSSFKIFTIEGKKISTGNVSSNSKIDVNNLPSGSYILYLSDGGFANFQKI